MTGLLRTEMRRFLELEAGPLSGSPRVRRWKKMLGNSVSSCKSSLSSSLLLTPLSRGSFSLRTLHTQVQPQHCLSTPIRVNPSSQSPHSCLQFPTSESRAVTDLTGSASQSRPQVTELRMSYQPASLKTGIYPWSTPP